MLVVRFGFGRASSPLSKVASTRRALFESSMVPAMDAPVAVSWPVAMAGCSFASMPKSSVDG